MLSIWGECMHLLVCVVSFVSEAKIAIQQNGKLLINLC